MYDGVSSLFCPSLNQFFKDPYLQLYVDGYLFIIFTYIYIPKILPHFILLIHS